MHNVFGHIVGTQKVESYILYTHWLVNLAINVLSAVTKITQVYIMHSANEKWFGDWQGCKIHLLEFKIPHRSLSTVWNQEVSASFLIPDSRQAACSQLNNSVNSASYNGQTGNYTYLSCRNLILEEYVRVH